MKDVWEEMQLAKPVVRAKLMVLKGKSKDRSEKKTCKRLCVRILAIFCPCGVLG
jgi:hypothetical protein